jgi:hypothetical protein
MGEMTKITLECDDRVFSASAESMGLNAEELVDMFGGLMILATYTHDTVCSVLNTETFHEPNDGDEE